MLEIGTVWSGDAAFIAKDNKDVEYVVPKEGGTIWADTLAIPKVQNIKSFEIYELLTR